MTDKIRNLLEDVQTVYKGKGMVVHPNSFDRLRMEVIKLDNINKQQNDKLTKAKEIIRQFLNDYPVITKEVLDKLEQFIKDIEK